MNLGYKGIVLSALLIYTADLMSSGSMPTVDKRSTTCHRRKECHQLAREDIYLHIKASEYYLASSNDHLLIDHNI